MSADPKPASLGAELSEAIGLKSSMVAALTISMQGAVEQYLRVPLEEIGRAD